MKKWYAVKVYAGQEQKAKRNIEKFVSQKNLNSVISDVKIPLVNTFEIKNGQKKLVQKKVMPGYIIINLDLTEEIRSMIQRLPSVSTFVSNQSDGKPKPLSDEEVKNLFSLGEEITDSNVVASNKVLYHLGDRLKIIDGPFTNFFGSVDEIFPDKGRLRLKVEIFGRSAPVELDFLQVQQES